MQRSSACQGGKEEERKRAYVKGITTEGINNPAGFHPMGCFDTSALSHSFGTCNALECAFPRKHHSAEDCCAANTRSVHASSHFSCFELKRLRRVFQVCNYHLMLALSYVGKKREEVRNIFSFPELWLLHVTLQRGNLPKDASTDFMF